MRVRNLLTLFVISVLFWSCSETKPKEDVETKNEEVEKKTPAFELKKGVNVSHWLSQCFGWSPRATFITEAEIKFVDSIGMDHVRIPLGEKEMWNEDGTKNKEAFDYLHKCIGWCQKYDIKVLIDLHILNAHHFNAGNGEGKITLWNDSTALQHFVDLWVQLSGELKQYPTDFLAYEFLNEPVAPQHEDWNNLLARCHKEIRKTEPNRYMVMGSNNWQIPETFPYLNVPENDDKIILAFHFYDPYLITHYSAYWTNLKMFNGPVQYPGKPISDSVIESVKASGNTVLYEELTKHNVVYNKETLAARLAPVFKRSKELNLPVICTEFGAYNKVDIELRRKYYNDITAVFDEHNVSWTHWDLKGDFGLIKYDQKQQQTIGIDTMTVQTLMQ